MAPYVEYRLTGGLNTKAAADVIGDGELRLARDAEFDELGTVSSRSSRTTLQLLGSQIYGEGDAVLGGTRYRISKAGTSVYLDDTSIGTFTGTGHISVVGYNDYAYIADGTTFKRYNLTTGLEDVGFDTPTTALSGAVTTTGGFFPAGSLAADAAITFKWVYTYYNGVAESNFSPVFSEDFNTDAPDSHHATDNLMTLTVPVGPSGTTARRIYRTDRDGEWFFRVGEIEDNTTTSFVDLGGLPDEADAEATSGDDTSNAKRDNPTLERPRGYWSRNLGSGGFVNYTPLGRAQTDYETSQLDTEIVMTNLGILADWNDHDPPPDTIRNLRFLTERVYGIDGNSIRWSLTSAPEHWSLYNEVQIGRQEGETLQTIEPLGADMICYTDAGVWRFTQGGLESLQSTLERVQSPVGVVSKWAVADLVVGGGRPAGHVFVATDGVYVFDGRQAVRISDKIEDLFRSSSTSTDRFNLSQMSKIQVASKTDKILVSYPAGSATTNNRTLLIDFEDPSDPKFAVWQTGYTTLHRDDDGKMIGGTSDGGLYELFKEGSENTSWTVQTKSFPITGITSLEKMESVVLDVDFGGLDTTVQVSVNRNGGNTETAQFTVTGSDGRTKISRYLPFYLRGDSVSVKVANTGAGRRKFYTVAFGFDEEETE